jgi:hypothetical protein
MAKRWNTKSVVDEDVSNICKIYADHNELPPQMVESYKEVCDSVNGWRPGLVIHFFTQLNLRCPDAMRYFKEEEKQN